VQDSLAISTVPLLLYGVGEGQLGLITKPQFYVDSGVSEPLNSGRARVLPLVLCANPKHLSGTAR
jgi:hypothetical protein